MFRLIKDEQAAVLAPRELVLSRNPRHIRCIGPAPRGYSCSRSRGGLPEEDFADSKIETTRAPAFPAREARCRRCGKILSATHAARHSSSRLITASIAARTKAFFKIRSSGG